MVNRFWLDCVNRNNQTNPFSVAPQKTVLPFRLYYPPPQNGIVPPIWLDVNFTLKADSQIAENTAIHYTNEAGEIFGGNNQNITVVLVGFYNTNATDTMQYFPIGSDPPTPHLLVSGVIFNRVGDSLVPISTTGFSFPVAGDYSPTITVSMQGGVIEEYTFENIKVHVLSASEIRTQELDQISIVIAITLLGFTLVQSIVLVRNLLKGRIETGDVL